MQEILKVNQIIVKRDQKTVLETSHLAVKQGEVLALIGPNGAGKSTLLMAISQILPIDHGEIIFQGKKINPSDQLEFRRQIGMVLQEPLLLDTTVFENIASGLRFRHINQTEINKRVTFWMQAFNISDLKKRKAHQLSGGEAQRVSLARALCLEPKILFLDEPFSALDKPTRMRLLTDFSALLADQKITTVFVTHDLDEALFLADRVAVMIGGIIRQVGPPHKVFTAPADMEIARFVGVETVIPGKIMGSNQGLLQIDHKGVKLEAVGEFEAGDDVYLCLRSEDVTLWKTEAVEKSSARNRFNGIIQSITPAGPLERVIVDCDGFSVVSLVTRMSRFEMDLQPQQNVQVGFKASAVHLIGNNRQKSQI